MRRQTWLAMLALLVVAALPALAGHEGHQKCTHTTQECLDAMASKMKNSGWVGVELEINEENYLMTVKKVVPNSPAEAAGIEVGDVLFALNGVKFAKENEEAIKQVKKDWQPGQTVTYTLKRNGLDKQVDVTLAPMPADVLAAWIGNHMMEHVSTDIAEKGDKTDLKAAEKADLKDKAALGKKTK
ncbi:MAG TPA: PDZ domain-containing protein [Candidatus Polarisedimenticolia bacterium]|jgi:predicted metalloprotease with PDZ domain|nr:PDZ domain-containing protein [Candidatus Polarisedimenticolia bacterium]